MRSNICVFCVRTMYHEHDVRRSRASDGAHAQFRLLRTNELNNLLIYLTLRVVRVDLSLCRFVCRSFTGSFLFFFRVRLWTCDRDFSLSLLLISFEYIIISFLNEKNARKVHWSCEERKRVGILRSMGPRRCGAADCGQPSESSETSKPCDPMHTRLFAWWWRRSARINTGNLALCFDGATRATRHEEAKSSACSKLEREREKGTSVECALKRQTVLQWHRTKWSAPVKLRDKRMHRAKKKVCPQLLNITLTPAFPVRGDTACQWRWLDDSLCRHIALYLHSFAV